LLAVLLPVLRRTVVRVVCGVSAALGTWMGGVATSRVVPAIEEGAAAPSVWALAFWWRIASTGRWHVVIGAPHARCGVIGIARVARDLMRTVVLLWDRVRRGVLLLVWVATMAIVCHGRAMAAALV